jgi:hypothetical protein
MGGISKPGDASYNLNKKRDQRGGSEEEEERGEEKKSKNIGWFGRISKMPGWGIVSG